MADFKKEISFIPGHDCIRFECRYNSDACIPGKGGSHGIHSMMIRFTLIGDRGAVQFLLSSGDWLPEPKRFNLNEPRKLFGPMAFDLGYHSLEPIYTNQEPMKCDLFEGGKCYYDGSGLNAEEPMRILFNYGDKELWKFLEGYYRHVFENADYPETNKPYPYALRFISGNKSLEI